MGRVSTWILVAAVVGLGLAATVDALHRGDDGAPQRARPEDAARERGAEPRAWRRAAADELAEHGIRGTLIWVDDACRVRAFRLPTLETVEAFRRRSCGPNGAGLLPRSLALRPGVREELGLREGRPVVSGAHLRRALGRNAWGLEQPVITEAAWLDRRRYAAIVEDEAGGGEIVAVFRGRRLVGAPPFAYGNLARLRASPYGTYAAAVIEDGGLVIVDAEGGLRPDGLSGAHAIAWSPDETWTAVARRDAVYLFETGTRAVSLIRLPIQAADLAWR
jgi:hypothetical protein